MKSIRFVYVMVVVVLAWNVGCSKKAEETPKPSSAVVQREGDRTIITDKEAGVEVIMGATEPPKGFPKDLPLIPDATLNASFPMSGNVFATFHTPKPLEEVKAFLMETSQLADRGWQVVQTRQTQRGFEISLLKDQRRAKIALTSSDAPPGTLVSYVAKGE